MDAMGEFVSISGRPFEGPAEGGKSLVPKGSLVPEGLLVPSGDGSKIGGLDIGAKEVGIATESGLSVGAFVVRSVGPEGGTAIGPDAGSKTGAEETGADSTGTFVRFFTSL